MPVCKRTGAPVNPTVAPCIQNLAKICYAASGVQERDLFAIILSSTVRCPSG